ncbi:MAG: septal ring lytic transglycosylase RlpA family protein [Solirubrobacteraceae bacterium]
MPRTIVRAGAVAGVLFIAASSAALAGEPLKAGTSTQHVRAGEKTKVWGDAPGKFVRFQTLSEGRWSTLERTRARDNGRFVLRARLETPTSAKTRVLSAGRTKKTGRLNVYRPALASWYGPGLYGNPLGCGGTLQYGTIGVAHKSLPCGTKLTIKHGKHEVRARVIDRGPYSGTREFDLTEATARRLHFSGVGTILTTR